MRRIKKKFSIGSLFKRDVIKNGKPSLFVSSHNRTVAFTDCCNFKKHGGVFKLLAGIMQQFFIFALSIKFYRILLNIAHFVRFGSTGRSTVYELSNKSFIISKNRVVYCILIVFILPVSEAVNRAAETRNLKREFAFQFIKIIAIDKFF